MIKLKVLEEQFIRDWKVDVKHVADSMVYPYKDSADPIASAIEESWQNARMCVESARAVGVERAVDYTTALRGAAFWRRIALVLAKRLETK